MNFLQAVQRVQDACSEAQATAAVGAAAGSLDEKFANFVREAYRTANTWKRWPWAKSDVGVTQLANPLFTVDPTLVEADIIIYGGAVVNDSLSYEDILNRYPQALLGTATGAPQFAAMKDYNTLFLYPTPTDANPETLITINGYIEIADPATDATVLAGSAQYHDAVVQLAYAIAVKKHFGDAKEAELEEAKAFRMLQRVASKARRGNSIPRIRS